MHKTGQRLQDGFWTKAHKRRDQLSDFFGRRIWLVSLDDLKRGRAIFYRAARVLYSAYRGARDNHLSFRAAALTHYTVLSIVPFLAFAFAVLKGFGAYRTFLEGTLRPWIHQTFQANPELERGITKIFEFVERTDVSSLGAVGLIFLVYTSISLLSNVEAVLNDLFGAKSKRPRIRQVTDYVTLVVTTPLLILVALAFATAASSSGVVDFLRETLNLGWAIDFLLRFTSFVVTCMAMFAMFVIMPNVRVRLTSALVGSFVGGILWQIALVLHVQFQMGVAKYNAVYAGFGAIPIFLVWTYASWLIVLLGAQLAAGHQNEQTIQQSLQARQVDQSLKETLALCVVAIISRDFLDSITRRSLSELSDELQIPPSTLDEVLEALVLHGIFARTVSGTTIGYLPSRDVDSIRVEDVRDALRCHPTAHEFRETFLQNLGEPLSGFLRALTEERLGSPRNINARELAGLAPARRVGVRDPAPDSRSEDEAPVLDAKQPSVT